jgi:hypothetical protein
MNWIDWTPLAQTLGTLSAVLTVLALIVGGVFALARYRREVRLHAADLLLKMEEEYRTIVRTCLDFEFLDRYQRIIVPVLKSVESGTMQGSEDIEMLARLDRCLRFFFLCTVLNADLKVEETAIARAYYYYVCVLAEPGKRCELQMYIAKYYARLNAWMKRHQRCMDEYRKTGDWDWRLVLDEQ